MSQLPLARRYWREAGARSRCGCCQADEGSTRPPGVTGRRQHAGIRKESESGGDYGAGGLSRDSSSFGPGSGARRLSSRKAAVTKRLVELAGGLTAVWIAVASPVAHLDHHLLTAHMVQHLLLTVVAAPLILLGVRPKILSKCRPHPAFCWIAGTVPVISWHVPVVFELAWRSRYWHSFEH